VQKAVSETGGKVFLPATVTDVAPYLDQQTAALSQRLS
jgi:hypothetical protein